MRARSICLNEITSGKFEPKENDSDMKKTGKTNRITVILKMTLRPRNSRLSTVDVALQQLHGEINRKGQAEQEKDKK